MDESETEPILQLQDTNVDSSISEAKQDLKHKDVEKKETEEGNELFERKLFVGNIGYRQTWKDLKSFFGKFGKVRYAQIVFDHITRRSKGIGFVEFLTREDADRCLMAQPEELILEGRRLRINFANESKKTTFKLYPPVPDLACTGDTEAEKSGTAVREQSEGDKSCILTVDEWKVIFFYLTVPEQIRLERVCCNWRKIALCIWKYRTELTCAGFSFKMLLTERILASLLNRCSGSLRRLDMFTSGHVLSEYSMTMIGHYCPRLEKLNISGIKATNTGLRDLSRRVTGLKWIKLQHCQHVAEKGLWWLLKNCAELEHIDFACNSLVTGKCFFLLRPKLKNLIASHCLKLTDYSIQELANKCPYLQELQIASCIGLTDAAVRAFTTLSHLRVLDVGGSFPNATKEPWYLLGKLHELTELRLDLNSHITDEAIKAIASGCPDLRTLGLSGYQSHVTDEGLSSLTRLNHLTSVNVSYIKQVTDALLEKLAEKGILEILVIHACLEVTDSGVQRVLELSRRLTLLDLSNNFCLTKSALASLRSGLCERQTDKLLEIVIGGTTMFLEEDKDEPLEVSLPSWVNLLRVNRANRFFINPDEMVYLPDPWVDDEEEDNLEAELDMFAKELSSQKEPSVSSEIKGCCQQESIDKRDDNLGAKNDMFVREDNSARCIDKMELKRTPPLYEVMGLELWEGEPSVAHPRNEQPTFQPATPGLFISIDDDFDEDYDEFLLGDDPLEMERWQMS